MLLASDITKGSTAAVFVLQGVNQLVRSLYSKAIPDSFQVSDRDKKESFDEYDVCIITPKSL